MDIENRTCKARTCILFAVLRFHPSISSCFIEPWLGRSRKKVANNETHREKESERGRLGGMMFSCGKINKTPNEKIRKRKMAHFEKYIFPYFMRGRKTLLLVRGKLYKVLLDFFLPLLLPISSLSLLLRIDVRYR